MRFGLTLLVRPSIGEALADDALGCHFGALIVAVTKRCARVVAEIELGKVAVQVLFLAVLIHALHAALEDRVIALDRVGVDRDVL
jgi:hypothetical protein